MNQARDAFSPDYISRWQELTRLNGRERYSDAGEVEFWSRNAENFERSIAADPDSFRRTLRMIAGYLRPEDTVLEIGAGTGRYTLPLARESRLVTAVDLSADMLTILHRKAREQPAGDIRPILGNWEEIELEQHDVVLAAWSLYRMHDVRAGITKLLRLAKRLLVIVDGDFEERPDGDPPHELLRSEIWGPDDPGVCNYLYFAGMLRQLGARADVRVITETARYVGRSPEEIAIRFVPGGATAETTRRFVDRLAAHIEPTEGGWAYSPRFAVGLVVWQRPGMA